MASNSGMNVGGIPLNQQKINKPFLREMWKDAKGAEVDEGKTEALGAIEELGKTGEMSQESLEKLDSYRKGVNSEWRSDNKAMWDTWRTNGKNWKDPKIKQLKEEMGVNGAFLYKMQKFTNELREATARSAVQGIAGGSFGPAATVAGYAAYSNGPQWDSSAQKHTEDLVSTFKEFLKGDSRMSTEGNSVKQVHRAELWKTLTDLTKKAAKPGENGKPLPVTAQYYELTSPEMVKNLADAAKAGSPLRVNVDPGRLSYPSTDKETRKKYFEVDDIPDKMRTVLMLAGIPKADVGVSIFPIKQELSDPTNLMHRKVLRVGDELLMSGMNANAGSGENLDAGYVIQGPAAAKFTANVARDIKTSAGAGIDEIWGQEHFDSFGTEDLRLGRRGLTAILDCVSGPSPAGTPLPQTESLKDLEALAKKAKLDLKTLVDVPADKYEEVMGGIAKGEGQVSLSDEGKKQLMGVMKKAVEATQTEKNIKALNDISLPSDKPVGKTKVDIGDLPTEREVLALNAINEAKEFIYIPGFVVTRAIAAALVAKQEEATANGKPLDIRVVADSGVYPDGGNPNSWGVNYLEDNGIPVRWAKLTRTGWHDRKIHAKELLTDQGEIAGSTNFSNKGMRDNWETSGYVHFEQGDKDAAAQREQSKGLFNTLWDESTFDLSAKDLAAYNNRFAPQQGREWAVEQDRDYNTKKILASIEDYEVQSGALVGKLLERTDIRERRDALMAEGYSDGDSALKACDELLGHDEFLKMRHDLPAHKEMYALKAKVDAWKEKYGSQ